LKDNTGIIMKYCLLCESSTIFVIEDALPGSYYHCRQCDLIFLEPNARPLPDEELERYRQHNNSPDNEGYVGMFAKFLGRAVIPYAKAGGRALDFGCGPGPVLQGLLQSFGFATEIYDPFFAPQLPIGKFDLITSTEVLEHVFDPAKVWNLISGMLHEGAVLALMTHFHRGPEMFPGWWYKNDITHVAFNSEITLSWLSAEYGFRRLFCDGEKTVTLQKL
jgi:hypothetical protein